MDETMATLERIMGRYTSYFKKNDLNLQVVLTNDMYATQKNYGFNDQDPKSLDEATAKKNWKHIAACMKYPQKMDEPFTLIFKRPYVESVPLCEKYRLMFHELTHIVDYIDYARLNHLSSYEELFHNQESVLFQHWSEYHAERRGYAAWLKHMYSIRLKYDDSPRKMKILEKETMNNIRYYGEHYTNTAEYGSTRQVYFTMHLLARMSIWMQILPGRVAEILSNDPFNYRGLLWIKKLMYLFQKYPRIDQMNDHFFDIAVIIAENMQLTKKEIWERIDPAPITVSKQL
ncbi:MAG: hypothetical protein U0K57_06125 [Lachnospiraceae bacterium]|nr:hypothetical protein [Lachnospiraceae bacterium]